MAKNPKKRPNKILFFSSLGIELGLTIFLSVKLGNWLDQHYQTTFNYYTMITTVIGFVASMYLLIKRLQKLQD